MFKPSFKCSELQDQKYNLYLDSQDIEYYLNRVKFNPEWKQDITGFLIYEDESELISVFCSESSHPYTLDAIYHCLPFYGWEGQNNLKCWNPDNQDYNTLVENK